MSKDKETEEQLRQIEEELLPSEEKPRRPTPTPQQLRSTIPTKTESHDDLEDNKVPCLISLPTSLKEKLKEEAYKQDVSRATIVREALSEYFGRLEKVEKQNPNKTVEIRKIKAITKESTGYFGNFDLEQFLEKTQEEELVGDEVWSKELLEAYLIPKIREASQGLLSNSLEDNCNLCIEALQLGTENVKFLARELDLEYSEEEGETEKPFKLM